MHLQFIDWFLIGAYFSISIAIGLYYSRRAGNSTSEFFLSGRNLPWWLAGTSMVATTFAADTPLAVTELVATNGIAGNWLWCPCDPVVHGRPLLPSSVAMDLHRPRDTGPLS